MKINRRIRNDACFRHLMPEIGAFVVAAAAWGWMASVGQAQAISRPPGGKSAQADEILSQVIVRLVRGDAFDAKLQQKVWAADREVVGVGTYLQSGGNSGRFRMQMKLHTGRQSHHFTQICDGRLAWIRTEVESVVSLRRVDVSRLNQWVEVNAASHHLPPGYLAGGLVEMLDTIGRDFDIQVRPAKLEGEPMIVITGMLKEDVRTRTAIASGVDRLAALHPTMVRVAVRTVDDPETKIGKGLPVRWEYWSDPIDDPATGKAANDSHPQESNQDSPNPPALSEAGTPGLGSIASRRLVSLLHLRSIRRITPPDEVEFRYENRDANVDFINETDRYLQRYGMRLTESQRLQLRR